MDYVPDLSRSTDPGSGLGVHSPLQTTRGHDDGHRRDHPPKSARLNPGAARSRCRSSHVDGWLIIIVLGITYAVHPPAGDPSTAWLMLSAGAAILAAFGVRALVSPHRAARIALRVGSTGLTLFAAAHLIAIGNADVGVLLFSIFAVVTGIGLTVAGVAVLRAGSWPGWRRGALLACGLPPITVIPLGAALGDIPHFSAIAVWGICWVLLGIAINRRMTSTGAIR